MRKAWIHPEYRMSLQGTSAASASGALGMGEESLPCDFPAASSSLTGQLTVSFLVFICFVALVSGEYLNGMFN